MREDHSMRAGIGLVIDPLDSGEPGSQITVVPGEDGDTVVRLSDARTQRVVSIVLGVHDTSRLGEFLSSCAQHAHKATKR